MGFSILLFIVFYLIVARYIFRLYNGVVKSKNKVEYAIGGVNTILKKRADLIPNIISVAKEHVKIEEEMFEKITMLSRFEKDQIIQKNAEISSLLESIMMDVKKYPTLKVNDNFIHLQRTLSEIEEQLSAARRTYNAHVMVYNNTIETVPSTIIASLMSYKIKSTFEIKESDSVLPNVKKLFK